MVEISKKFSKLRSVLILSWCLCIFSICSALTAEPIAAQGEELQKLNGEITEIEELNDPQGTAIYTVRDLSSGKTIRLFVDPHKSLIQMGGKSVAAGDALGGSKAIIIYQKSPGQEMPEVVFARVTSSYYS